jgi:hypothetical protein
MKTYVASELDAAPPPEVASWPVDGAAIPNGHYTASALRRRLPRLTRDADDASLEGRSVADRRSAKAVVTAPALRRVRHPKFGEGTILSTEGSGETETLVIDFPAGRKTVLRRFVSPVD